MEGIFRDHFAKAYQEDTATDVAAQPSREFRSHDFYRALEEKKLRKMKRDDHGKGKPLAIPGLRPTLRKYQDDAVRWMLAREKGEVFFEEQEQQVLDREGRAFDGWTCLTAADGKSFWYNRTSAELAVNPPEQRVSPYTVKGGILADEMGLGKTGNRSSISLG